MNSEKEGLFDNLVKKSFLGQHRSRHRQVRLLDPEGDLSAEAKDLAGDPGERHQDLLAARL